jgi:membrane protein YdbS with pleckstrin-like domain
MKCQVCGAEAQATAAFCPECGARIDTEASGAPAPAADETPQGAGPPAARALQGRRDAARDSADEAEQTIWEGGYSPKAMIGAWVLSGILTVALVVGGIILAEGDGRIWAGIAAAVVLLWVVQLARLAYRRLSIHYRLTTQRFFHESGILRRVTDRIETIDMDDITAEQGLFERLVGVGSIHIVSSDRTHPDLTLHGIDNVKEIAHQLDDMRRKERMRRGLHIEQV